MYSNSSLWAVVAVVTCPSTETALEVQDLTDDIVDWISSLGSFAYDAEERGRKEAPGSSPGSPAISYIRIESRHVIS